jgi:mannose/cellobiose epimerase-like protein (N-acyl-D-glucosamine 2-epimerase family)
MVYKQLEIKVMKNVLITLITLFVISFPVKSQYTIQSKYLVNPDLSIGYVDSCATFWLQTWDHSSAGFYTNINKTGNLIVGIPANKHMLTQTRNAYGLTRAFMLTGDTTYLNYARNALDFMYQSAWDQTNGGWYKDIDVNGNPIYPLNDKSTFHQLYALLGISAFYEATDDSLAYEWLFTGYDYNENILWDNRTGYEGYFDLTDYDGSNPRNKSFNATVDAITTYMLYTYLMFDDMSSWSRLGQLSNQIIDHMVASMDAQAIGFVEKYDSDWNWNNNETMTIMGHVLKSAWCLGRVYQNDPDTSYINAAEKLVLDVWNNGYDNEFGGPYKDYNRVTGQMLMWGNPDTAKAWWQMEQAVTAGLMLYDITGDSVYLQMADESLDFFMRYFVDHTYSEVYADRTRYGNLAWNENKGGNGKAAYHSIELGYYTYLYGNLFVHGNPVTLHYRFEPEAYSRDILLSPLAITDNRLKIQNILKDGNSYSNFDAYNRILTLSAGESGIFAVSFELVDPAYVSNETGPNLPGEFILKQNFPNPFNSTTNIEFYLPTESNIELTVYNSLGQEIEKLFHGKLTKDTHRFVWQSELQASGIYFYKVKLKNRSIIKKMILLK